jgi:hypothetical protein
MGHMFFNGPIQNGDFTFASRPGKAVGIRIAGALNYILGARPVPHLWNTVTLAGDLRYRQHLAAGQGLISRYDFEASIIAAKYGTGLARRADVVTDADSGVADLAISMISSGLSTGVLKISSETVQVCAKCGHMTGTGHHPCKACGHDSSRATTGHHLIAERGPGELVFDNAQVYARKRRPPLHLRSIAGNTPSRLILSRTRDHGINLGPLGLRGLVLDPRVGIHVAVLAVAHQRQADVAVMTITQNAAANVAAYGRHFTHHGGLRLLYGLHGHVPYHQLAGLRTTYKAYRVGTEARTAFETWFLPLCSLKEKNGLRSDQLPALFRHFHRAYLARTEEPDQDVRQAVRQSIREGDTDWIMSKTALATAMFSLPE